MANKQLKLELETTLLKTKKLEEGIKLVWDALSEKGRKRALEEREPDLRQIESEAGKARHKVIQIKEQYAVGVVKKRLDMVIRDLDATHSHLSRAQSNMRKSQLGSDIYKPGYFILKIENDVNRARRKIKSALYNYDRAILEGDELMLLLTNLGLKIIKAEQKLDKGAYPMTNKDLIAIGKYLYGEFWQSQLARALNVDVRTVQRWVAGDVAIKESVADEIILMAVNKTYQRYKDSRIQRLCINNNNRNGLRSYIGGLQYGK